VSRNVANGGPGMIRSGVFQTYRLLPTLAVGWHLSCNHKKQRRNTKHSRDVAGILICIYNIGNNFSGCDGRCLAPITSDKLPDLTGAS